MSFLLDIVLIGVLALIVVIYSKRSIFAAAAGLLSVALAAVGAIWLTAPVAAPLNDYVVAPLVEQAAAGELADMFSAPHLSGGRETVASLPLGDLVTEQPEAYLQLLRTYSVQPEAVAAAYAQTPTSETVLVALTADYAVAFSRAAVLIILTLALSLLLRFIARQIEQNFPPARRYRGFKKALPALLGAGAGLLWSWVIATVIHWVVPVVAGQVIFLSPDVLYATDWYRFLWWTNPLLPLFALLG